MIALPSIALCVLLSSFAKAQLTSNTTRPLPSSTTTIARANSTNSFNATRTSPVRVTSTNSTVSSTTGRMCPTMAPCPPKPTCQSGRQAQGGPDRDANGCQKCVTWECVCLPKPCPPPRTCPNGNTSPMGNVTKDSAGCPNCPTWLACPDESTPCCPPPKPAPTCGQGFYIAVSTVPPVREGCTATCSVQSCEQCQFPPCAAPPTCGPGVELLVMPMTFSNGCPGCAKYLCMPECPPYSAQCQPCPTGTKEEPRKPGTCQPCPTCIRIEEGTRTSVSDETGSRTTVKETASAIEKSGIVQGATTVAGDLFESENNGGMSTAGAVTVSVGAIILLAASM